MKKQHYLKLIQKHFPKLKFQKAKLLTHGWDHDVIILDNEILFRFPKTKDYIKNFKDDLSLMDFLNEKTTLQIPKYTYIAKDKSFAGYKIIKGKLFKRWVFEKISGFNRKKIAKQIAQFLNELHGIPLSKIREFHVKEYNSIKELKSMQKNFKKKARQKLTLQERKVADKYFETCLKLDMKDVKKVFIHADIHADNMVVKHDFSALAGVFDFSDKHIGDPAIDFAHLWNYGPKFVKEVYKHYKGSKDDELLYRAKLYFYWDAFGIMIESFKDIYDCEFEEGYRMFKGLKLPTKRHI